MTNMIQRDNAALQRLAGELLETLQPARLALDDQPGDKPTLTGCAHALDQTSRVLRASDLHGLAMLAEESAALARTLANPRAANRGDALGVLSRAVQALPRCVETLASAEAGCPPVLLQLLNDLRQLRGEAQLAQGSLFTPALVAVAPTLPAETLAARSTAELPALLRKLRQTLQVALLGLLREPSQTASLVQCGRVFARLERLAGEAPQDVLWSAAAALVQGLESGALSDGPAVRLLLRQLDRQLRQLVEEGAPGINRTPPDALLRGLLFYVALLPDGSPRGEALKARYVLPEALPSLARLDQFAARTQPAITPLAAVGAPAFDPQLLDIFSREAEAHLATLQAFLQQCVNGLPQLPTDELERALHTLRGSALLAGVLPVAEIATPMEAMIRDFRVRQLAVTQREVERLQAGEGLLRRALHNLPDDPLAPLDAAPAFILSVQAAHWLRLEQPERSDPADAAVEPDRCRCGAPASSIINSLGLIDEAWLVDGEASAGPDRQRVAQAVDREILQLFIEEASDLLVAMQAELASWRAQPEISEPSRELLRILHTLKGSARLAGQFGVGDLAHALEQLLAQAAPDALEQATFGYLRLRNVLDALGKRLQQQAGGESQVGVASLRVPRRLLRVPDESLEQLSQLTARAASLRERITRLTAHNAPLDALLAEQVQLDEEIEHAVLRARQVPFDELLPRLRRLVAQLAGQLGKPIVLRCEDALGEIDRGLLARLVAPLEHLLRNAIGHGIESADQRRIAGKPESGTLTLQLNREGDDLLLVLADDGAGIDYAAVRRQAVERGLLEADAELSEQAALDLILSPGFSTAAQLTQTSGRGIGLDVVNTAIQELGGSLQVESTAGQGSRWSIRLPESQREVTGAPLPRVMLVDDSPTARQVVGRLLERNGMHIEVFADGKQALERLHESRPELVILDRNLPQPDGLEIARRIRDDASLADLPILMLSADEAPLDATQAGWVDACLAKPYQDAQLLGSVQALLERSASA